jgi:hypothetical protein
MILTSIGDLTDFWQIINNQELELNYTLASLKENLEEVIKQFDFYTKKPFIDITINSIETFIFTDMEKL